MTHEIEKNTHFKSNTVIPINPIEITERNVEIDINDVINVNPIDVVLTTPTSIGTQIGAVVEMTSTPLDTRRVAQQKLAARSGRRAWSGTVVAFLLIQVSGCGGSKSTESGRKSASPTVHALTALDISGSESEADHRQRLAGIELLVDRVLPAENVLHLWTYAGEATPGKLFGSSIRRSKELWATEEKKIFARHDQPEPGTRLAVALKAILPHARAAQEEEEPVVVVIASNGDDTRPKESAPLIQSLAKLNVIRSLWLVGLNGTPRAIAEERFAVFGDRLVPSGPDEIEQGLKRVEALLEEGNR